MTKLLRFLILICFVLMLSPLAVAQKQHAFIWNNTTGIQDIGTLGGDTSYACTLMIAARSSGTLI